MKQLFFNTTFVFFSIFLLWSNVFSQGNWEQILPPGPTSNQMVGLFFVDGNTGWSVGEHGTILKTTDSGETWCIIDIPWQTYLQDVFFVDEMIGYIVGQNGLILKSVDGGESWAQMENFYTNNLHKVKFLDENNGWTIGEKGLILSTIDGGENWVQQLSNVREDLHGISFIGTNSLCVVGKNFTILKSSIEDSIWQSISFEPAGLDQNKIYHFYDVFFLNEAKGWIGGGKELYRGTILYTANGGTSWIEKQVELAEHQEYFSKNEYPNGIPTGIQQIFFLNKNNGFILTHPDDNHGITTNIPFFTSDGGKNWKCEILGNLENSNHFGRLFRISDNLIINTGFQGEFRFAKNNLNKWIFPNAPERIFYDIYAGNNGVLLARKFKKISEFPNQLLVFCRSTDYGNNWQEFNPSYFDSTGIQFEPEFTSTKIIQNEKDQILWTHLFPSLEQPEARYKSIDLGLTWHFVRNEILWAEQMLSPDTMISYRVEQFETAPANYRSRVNFTNSLDGGKTKNSYYFDDIWNDILASDQSISDNRFISNCYFFNGKTGFLFGSEGNIIKTENTGQNWEAINSGVVEHLWDMEFIDRSTGFSVGDFGRILKSEDGGQHWRKTNSGTQENIYSVAFKNEMEGWAGTESGILYTIDGGENWKGVPLRYHHGLVRHIKFDKNGNGYAYSCMIFSPYILYERFETRPKGYSYLLRFKNDVSTVTNTNGDIAFPQTIVLKQNYPNPFNNSTKINYELGKPGIVILKIFNLQGQLVKKLVDKSQKAGEHTILWDGRSGTGEKVTSAVYIYSIEVNKIIQTKKMLYLQ